MNEDELMRLLHTVGHGSLKERAAAIIKALAEFDLAERRLSIERLRTRFQRDMKEKARQERGRLAEQVAHLEPCHRQSVEACRGYLQQIRELQIKFDRLTEEVERLETMQGMAYETCEFLEPKAKALERIRTISKADMPIHLKVGKILHELEILDLQQEPHSVTRAEAFFDKCSCEECKPKDEEEVLREIIKNWAPWYKGRVLILSILEKFRLR